jgi:hypothetical protein
MMMLMLDQFIVDRAGLPLSDNSPNAFSFIGAESQQTP